MEDDVGHIADADSTRSFVPASYARPFAVDESSGACCPGPLRRTARFPEVIRDGRGRPEEWPYQVLINFGVYGEWSVIGSSCAVFPSRTLGWGYSRAGDEAEPVMGEKLWALYSLFVRTWSSADGATSVNAKTRRLCCLADLLSRPTCYGEQRVSGYQRTTSAFEPKDVSLVRDQSRSMIRLNSHVSSRCQRQHCTLRARSACPLFTTIQWLGPIGKPSPNVCLVVRECLKSWNGFAVP